MRKPAISTSLSDWHFRRCSSLVPHLHALHSPSRSGITPNSLMMRARSSGLMRAMSIAAIRCEMGRAATRGR
eukprot:3435194-Pyramimonas_sp.AAC.1